MLIDLVQFTAQLFIALFLLRYLQARVIKAGTPLDSALAYLLH